MENADEILNVEENAEENPEENLKKEKEALKILLRTYGDPIFEPFSTEQQKQRAWNLISAKMKMMGLRWQKEILQEISADMIEKCNCKRGGDLDPNVFLVTNDCMVIHNAGEQAGMVGSLYGFDSCTCF